MFTTRSPDTAARIWASDGNSRSWEVALLPTMRLHSWTEPENGGAVVARQGTQSRLPRRARSARSARGCRAPAPGAQGATIILNPGGFGRGGAIDANGRFILNFAASGAPVSHTLFSDTSALNLGANTQPTSTAQFVVS